MSTPLPGQIRCPTCHRSTPPAAFCTQCGTAIPASARARPRGLDREELQDRIRTHRPGDAAFRRGSSTGDAADQGYSPYQPFRPEPEDNLVLPGSEAGDPAGAHIDNTPAGFDDQPAEPPPPPIAPPPATPWRPAAAAAPLVSPAATNPPSVAPRVVATPPPVAPSPPPPAQQWTGPDEPWLPPDPYEPGESYDPRYRAPGQDDWDRRGPGVSALAIGGFVLLGVLAIAMGAFVSGIFSGGTANASQTPTPSASVAPSITLEPSFQPSLPPTGPASPGATSGPPGTFPDGFTARTEPCAEEPASGDGCSSSGATVSGGSVWAWIGFRKGNNTDVLSVSIVNASGASVGDGSLELGSLGCDDSCSGWARFRFNGLPPGTYQILVNRNGQPAAEAPFTVTA